jgi:molecular chaperone IbpA
MEDMVMPTFDLSPLFRSTVGFDNLNRLFDSAFQVEGTAPTYPPYNIEKTGANDYRITMAVAGLREDDLTITVQEDHLVIAGRREKQDVERKFLHRGIAERAFERRFELAEHVHAVGASIENGLLHVDLVREIPEAMKPRTIKIATKSDGRPAIDAKAA